jgi:hypothetical protein
MCNYILTSYVQLLEVRHLTSGARNLTSEGVFQNFHLAKYINLKSIIPHLRSFHRQGESCLPKGGIRYLENGLERSIW